MEKEDDHYGAKPRARPGKSIRRIVHKGAGLKVSMSVFMDSFVRSLAAEKGFESPASAVRLLIGAVMAGVIDIDEVAAEMLKFRWADLKNWPDLGGIVHREGRDEAVIRARAEDRIARAYRDGRNG